MVISRSRQSRGEKLRALRRKSNFSWRNSSPVEMGKDFKPPIRLAGGRLSKLVQPTATTLKLWQPSVLIRISLLILILGSQFARSLLVEKWTVGISGDADEANRIASEIGCKNLGIVTGFNDVYLFEKRVDPLQIEKEDSYLSGDENHLHRTKRELELHPSVAWVDPQTPQKRVKRGFITSLEKRQLQQPIAPASSQTSISTHSQASAGAAQAPPLVSPHQQAASPTIIGQAATGTISSTGSFKAPFQQSSIGGNSSGSNNHQTKAVSTFNDELWTHQWYLQDNANVAHIQSDIDLKVQDVWSMGITGHGVVVTILDDGLEWNHTDIYPNYDPLASWDMNNNRSDPFPRYDSRNYNSHGTRCAGEVAMVANNKKCGVGVAPRARIGGIKCLDGDVADHIESMSLLHNLDHIDIYSGSWGPMDNGHLVEGPKRLASQALERGVRHGRRGKGALYIWANGNGGAEGDNCNCDGYVTSIYTISIGGVTQQGQMPFYGERCSSTLAVTCSSGVWTDRKIVTTDLHNKCTVEYTGSSAAAPLAAGIFALVLEANNNITWRDAQHLTVASSDPLPIRDNPGWKRNAAGFFFNNRFGFGLMNAKAMVDAALTWQQVPRKSICIVSPTTRLPVYVQSRQMAQVVFVTDGCQREYEQQQQQQQQQQQHLHLQQQQQHQQQHQHQHQQQQQAAAMAGGRMMTQPGQFQQQQFVSHPSVPGQQQQQQQPQAAAHSHPTPVIYLEHVQVIVDIEYTSRGELDIFLVSPSGTMSTLMSRRPLDVSRNGFDKWPLMSVHFWGEPSHGQWTLIVRDKDSQNNRGLLRNVTLVLHGTSLKPAHMLKPRVYQGESQVPSFVDPVNELDEDNIYDLNTFPNDVSLVGDDSYQPTFVKSVIAMEKSNSRRE